MARTFASLGREAVSASDVILRTVRDEDLPVFFAHQSDAAAAETVGEPPRDRAAFDAHWARIRRDPSVRLRTVLLDGEVAGYLGSFLRKNLREVCYWYGREHWGRGVATAALSAFLRELAERPVYARVTKGNAASMRVLRKCGFTPVAEDRYTNSLGRELAEILYKVS